MKMYELVNKNRDLDIIENLIITMKHKTITDVFKLHKINYMFPSKAEAMIELKWYKDLIGNIVNEQHLSENFSLNLYLKEDYLSYDEALFCLLGLNPRAIHKSNKNKSKIKGRIFKKYYIANFGENRLLTKAPRIGEEGGFISDKQDRVYTKGLIPWAIKKDLIKEVTVTTSVNNQPNKPRKKSKTIQQQELINKLAKKTVGQYPDITQEMLALELSQLEEVKISEGTIRRNYLDKYPKF